MMGEDWDEADGDGVVWRGDGDSVGSFHDDSFAAGERRAQVAVLGKKALAVLLRNNVDPRTPCSECDGRPSHDGLDAYRHDDRCPVAAILADAHMFGWSEFGWEPKP